MLVKGLTDNIAGCTQLLLGAAPAVLWLGGGKGEGEEESPARQHSPLETLPWEEGAPVNELLIA